MNYSDLKTYTRTQAKYIRKIFELRTNQNEYKSKISELCGLRKTYESVVDDEDLNNIRDDIQNLENNILNAENAIKKYACMIEHIEILCHCYGGSGETEYLKQKPEEAKKWVNMTLKDFENRYGCNLENLGETDESERESITSTKSKQKTKTKKGK